MNETLPIQAWWSQLGSPEPTLNMGTVILSIFDSSNALLGNREIGAA